MHLAFHTTSSQVPDKINQAKFDVFPTTDYSAVCTNV